jgi:hypothetical protein
MRGYTQEKDAYLRRLRRIEGQVPGIARTVDEDVCCIDVSGRRRLAGIVVNGTELGEGDEVRGALAAL